MGQPTHCYDAEKITDDISLEIIKGDYDFVPLVGKKIKLIDEHFSISSIKNTIIN